MNHAILLSMLLIPELMHAAPPADTEGLRPCSVEVLVNPTTLSKGDYLDVEYLERLTKTLSPSAAEGDVLNPLARVSADDIVLIGNWHDAGIVLVLSPTGVALQYDPEITCSVSIPDATHFTLALSSEPRPLRFTHVGDLDELVQRLLFVGVYVDDQGEVWRFESGGHYRREGRQGSYALHGDDGGYYDDLVWVDGVRYRFVRTQESLRLYNSAEPRKQGLQVPVYALRVKHE